MDERRASNEAINACLAEIALLRKELEWIGETTHDPEIKFKVHSILRRSLEMPPQENDG
jgi:hypothetical protein